MPKRLTNQQQDERDRKRVLAMFAKLATHVDKTRESHLDVLDTTEARWLKEFAEKCRQASLY